MPRRGRAASPPPAAAPAPRAAAPPPPAAAPAPPAPAATAPVPVAAAPTAVAAPVAAAPQGPGLMAQVKLNIIILLIDVDKCFFFNVKFKF